MNTNQQFSSPPRLAKRSKGNGQTRFEKETAANGGKVDTFHDPASLGPWVLGDTIGKGASGRVRLARHCQSGKLAAVKIIPKNIMFSSRASLATAGAKQDKAMLGIRREIVIMKLIDHPNIMGLYDVFEADNDLYLLLEYIEGGELFDFLVSKGRLPPQEALKYFREVIYGIDYCHRFNICHRDLKPENLLLDTNQRIKVADFGMAAMEIDQGMLETSCGSPHYASPEIVAGKLYHGAASDIWSCGVVLYALLVGRLPFDDHNMRILLQKVRAGRFDIPAHVHPDAQDLIRKMLVVDPERRIEMHEIQKHPFFCMTSVPFLNVPEPPSPEQLNRVVLSERDIDPVILRNLEILWHGVPRRAIIQALLSPEPRWEKGHYFLLHNYQLKVMEEYDEGYSFGFQSGKWKPPLHLIQKQMADMERRREEHGRRKERERAVAPPPPLTTTPSPRHSQRPAPNAVPFPGAANDIFAPTPAPRPRAPSPTKRQSHSRPRPSSVVGGPRPPSVHGSQIARSQSPNTPQTAITSLTEEMDRMRMPPPALPPPSRRSTAPDVAAQSPKSRQTSSDVLTNAQNANAEVVKARFGFGNPERAEAFNSPARRSTSPAQGLGLSFAGQAAQPPAPTASQLSAPQVKDPAVQKFLDDVAGMINTLASPPRPNESPRARPMSGDPRRMLSPPPISRTGSSTGSDYSDSGSNAEPRGRSVGTARPRANTTDSFVVVKEDDVHIIPPTPHKDKKNKPAPLDFTAGHNRASTFGPLTSPIPSPLLTPSEFVKGPSWFSSLFNFKPAQYHYYSVHPMGITRREMARLLEMYGASVAVEESGDGTGVLRCQADKVYDVTGGYHNKSVKFRVQFAMTPAAGSTATSRRQSSTPSTPVHTHAQLSPMASPMLSPGPLPSTSLPGIHIQCTLVQERGARSTLDAIASRLTAEWKLLQGGSIASHGDEPSDA